MLALITQSNVTRPWIQLGTGTIMHFPLKCIEGKTIEAEVEVQVEVEVDVEVEVKVESRKQTSSKIPRLIRPVLRREEKSLIVTEDPIVTEYPIVPEYAIVADTCKMQSASVAGSSTCVATVAPVVRSTRTSQCRIKLAHPECPPVRNRKPSVSPVTRKRKTSESSIPPPTMKRKSVTEPLLQLVSSVIEIADPFKNTGGRKQLLQLLCSDQKQINVPFRLINRYSSLIRDRQKENNFCSNRPIYLESINSKTLLRLIQWMQQHCHDDLKQLQKASPSLKNANTVNCTWDERFLGLKLEPVLQLLLAANFLGINPLKEHTLLYFSELIEQRISVQPYSLQNEKQTDHQLLNSSGHLLC